MFWKRVEKTQGCWLWYGSLNTLGGYGRYNRRPAHVISWELKNGSVPPGMKVCHQCDVKVCVNPDHLFLGTQRDNMRDAMGKGRWDPRVVGKRAAQIQCIRGHELTRDKRGKRRCKTCHAAAQRVRRQQSHAAMGAPSL